MESTVFLDRWGILLVDFLIRGETVNAEHYCETLQKLQWAIQNMQHGMLITSVVMMHDNAWLFPAGVQLGDV